MTTPTTLGTAQSRLDQVMAQLRLPFALRQWEFWHGPPEEMPQHEALAGRGQGWTKVTTPTRWSTAEGDAWFRTVVSYPEAIEGISTQGTGLELVCSLLVNSKIFVDGQLAASHDWWLDAKIAPIPLTDSYAPGQEIQIACHIPQGDGLGSFGGADVRVESIFQASNDLEMLKAQLAYTHFLIGRQGDAKRLGEWENVVGQLPWDALEDRDWSGWREGAAAAVGRLAKLVPEAKEHVVHAAAHAHIDMNWLWPWEDTVDVIQRDFATMDQFMDRFPELRFSQSQASTYWAMEVYRPDLLERVQKRVREGRWEVTANTWVENDLNMSCGEAIARHFLYTRRYMRQLFGDASRVMWEPDTFGHPATMPQIVRKGGAEFYYFCRGGQTRPLFWWEAADGSRLLAFKEPDWYLGPLAPTLIANSAIQLATEYDLPHSLVVYGVGDHGGGATVRDLEMARRINEAPCLPRLEMDSVEGFFQAVVDASPDLPVVRQELNPVFAGCYTSHADVKLLNRRGEAALLDAEALATVASLRTGHVYPKAALEHHWRTVLFQQFHDILCGCGIGLTSKTAHAWAEPAIASAQAMAQEALRALNAELDVEQGAALSVFNTLPWPRTDWVKAPADWECAWVVDEEGNRIAAQRSAEGLLFVAQDVPALGCRVYRPAPDDASEKANGVGSPGGLILENEFLLLEVDERSGAIRRLLDKEAGRDLTQHAHRSADRGAELQTTGPLNRMTICWEEPHGMSAWKLGNISRVDYLVHGAQVSLTEAGPVRGTIEVRRKFLNSRLAQRIHLYQGSRRIEFETEVEWHERGSESADAPMLRVAFDAFLGETIATYQIPFGTIQRPADGQEVVAQMWGDLSERDGGYGVALLNDCKYGYQAQGNTLGLTLVRASYEPDQNPDEGLHRFTYAFYPHLGSWKDAQVEQRAQELNRPLCTQLLEPPLEGRGQAEPDSPALECEGEGVVVTSVRMAEDGEGVVIRLLEMHGQEAEATVQLFKPIVSAQEVSLAEEPLEGGEDRLSLHDGELQVRLAAHEIRTLYLRL